MKPEQDRLQNLLCETITMLCRNGLSYKSDLKVQGLLAITVDASDVFIVHLNERIEDAIGGFVIPVDSNGLMNPLPNHSSVSPSQVPDVSQNFVSNAVQDFELLSNRHVGGASSHECVEAETGSECKVLKVEPLSDEEENANGVELMIQDDQVDTKRLINDRNTDKRTAFDISRPACSSSLTLNSSSSYRISCDSESEILLDATTRKDFSSDASVAVPIISSSLRLPVNLNDGTQNQGDMMPQTNPNFTNIAINPSLLGIMDGTHGRLTLPKLMRGFIPAVPGFTGRQQAVTKSDRPLLFLSQRRASRLPRRPRESTEKHFACPFCGLSYYYKKHLKFHLRQKHGF